MDSTDRIIRTRKPQVCPACKQKSVANILYGMPAFSPELDAALKAGTIVLGGCCISGDDPTWRCTKCSQAIYRINEEA
ncbi:MAG: hypothetical protein ACYDBB_26360 [Armatimonadota bacterium]